MVTDIGWCALTQRDMIVAITQNVGKLVGPTRSHEVRNLPEFQPSNQKKDTRRALHTIPHTRHFVTHSESMSQVNPQVPRTRSNRSMDSDDEDGGSTPESLQQSDEDYDVENETSGFGKKWTLLFALNFGIMHCILALAIKQTFFFAQLGVFCTEPLLLVHFFHNPNRQTHDGIFSKHRIAPHPCGSRTHAC
jgi:hypothetical protein